MSMSKALEQPRPSDAVRPSPERLDFSSAAAPALVAACACAVRPCDQTSCEFALVVGNSYTAQGLGSQPMLAIDAAHATGLQQTSR